MQYLFILIAGLLQIASCDSAKKSKSETRTDPAYNWTVLLAGQQSEIEEGKNLIIKSQKDFDSLWNEMQTGHPDQPEKPKVDFQSKWVIACFLGNVSSAGHSIEMKSVINENNKTVLFINHRKPGNDCVTAQVIESPYVLISTDHFTPGPVEFRVEVLDEKCE